jgi:hypothetical protein
VIRDNVVTRCTARPILVTGSQRSGTTWTAEVMSRGGNVELVDEPFNITYRPRRVKRPFPHWFQYITSENEAEFCEDLDFVFDLHYPIAQAFELRERQLLRKFQRQFVSTVRARRNHRRVLCKDPIGVFSAPWIYERYGCDVVICVRHPAAFVSSLLRLGWEFDFNHWLEQPLFMRDCAGPYAQRIEEFAHKAPPLIDQAILLWKVIYARVASYREFHPDWLFTRHEDLSRDPIRMFSKLYCSCGLQFSTVAREFVMSTSSQVNPAEAPVEDFKVVVRNSMEASRIWTTRLTPDEIRYIREGTEPEAERFYRARDWLSDRPSAPGTEVG